MALDPNRVGQILINWVHAAAQLGHVSPRGTSVYVHPQDEEGKFVRAMMDGERTVNLVRRWPELHDLSAEEIFYDSDEPVRPYELRAVNGSKSPKKEPGFGRLSGRDPS